MTADEHMMMAVEDLTEGMRVDLEDDPYADPNHDSTLYECEWQVVADVTQETPECTAVSFDDAWVGFPHGHMVKVRKESA